MENKTTLNILKVVIVSLLGFAFVMFVFAVGIWVGQKKAEFSFRWAEMYHRNFAGPAAGIFGNFSNQDIVSGHGIFGQVIKIDGNDIMVRAQNNREETVVISNKTTIVNGTKKITVLDIKLRDSIVIIGSPDSQGQIQAEFIRILPVGSMSLLNTNCFDSAS
jgi:hypothetical protein